MADGIVTVLQCLVPNPAHRGIENWKMYAVKEIIYEEYGDMVPKASTGSSGTPRLRPIRPRYVHMKTLLYTIWWK